MHASQCQKIVNYQTGLSTPVFPVNTSLNDSGPAGRERVASERMTAVCGGLEEWMLLTWSSVALLDSSGGRRPAEWTEGPASRRRTHTAASAAERSSPESQTLAALPAHTHTHTRTHRHRHMHTQTHTDIHAHAHTHASTQTHYLGNLFKRRDNNWSSQQHWIIQLTLREMRA